MVFLSSNGNIGGNPSCGKCRSLIGKISGCVCRFRALLPGPRQALLATENHILRHNPGRELRTRHNHPAYIRSSHEPERHRRDSPRESEPSDARSYILRLCQVPFLFPFCVGPSPDSLLAFVTSTSGCRPHTMPHEQSYLQRGKAATHNASGDPSSLGFTLPKEPLRDASCLLEGCQENTSSLVTY